MASSHRARMSLKHRILLPNSLYVILLAVVAGLFFYSDAKIGSLNLQQRSSLEVAGQFHATALAVKSFLNHEIDSVSLEKQFQELQAVVHKSDLAGEVASLWKGIEGYSKLESENHGIEEQIFSLTSNSIKQSNDYIKIVSDRLADEQARSQVSKLECVVLGAANVNTSSSYELKVKFLQLKEDMSVSQDMLNFLDILLNNVEVSIGNLAGTPFQQMAIIARDSNQKVKEAILAYIGNVKEQRLISKAMFQSIGKITSAVEANTLQTNGDIFSQIQSNYKLLLAVAVVVAFLGLLIGFLQASRISAALRGVITGLSQGADDVASAAAKLNSAGQALSSGASQQAASIEETSASMEELASMTKTNAENASTADSLSQESSQAVQEAQEAMEHLTISMGDITQASEQTSKIIKTIDEIAFQTNLLALNAAVEAARAGEAGAGFAVVAEEVRSLAKRAADAARNTAELIAQTLRKVQEGSGMVERTNQAFQAVAVNSGKVARLIGEIASASSEQAQGIDQVNKAMTEMDRVVQTNAAGAEETASSSEEMSAQAQGLLEVVAELAALVDGGRGRMEQAGLTGPRQASATYATRALPVGRAAGGRRKLAWPAKAKGRAPSQAAYPDEHDFTEF